jgi:antibiotic biosynthesis monooxygenase
MPFISLTRLRVRSFLYLPLFVWKALASARQAERTPGFLGGRIVREARNTFWTLTAWQDAAAMKSFRDTGTHREVMPKLLHWCDEASVAHWDQQSTELPEWPEAYRRMVAEGRASKVNKPSQAHIAKRIVEPRLNGHEGRVLKGSNG